MITLLFFIAFWLLCAGLGLLLQWWSGQDIEPFWTTIMLIMGPIGLFASIMVTISTFLPHIKGRKRK